MKIKAAMVVSALALLAACGGGGGSVSNAPPSTSPNVTTLKSYSDGAGVLSVRGTSENTVVGALDLQAAREVANGSMSLTVVPNSFTQSGTLYNISRTGVASNGQSVRTNTAGRFLNIAETEYASISYIIVNSNVGLAASASPVNGFPAGSHTYTGTSMLLSNYVDDGRAGNFTLTANFNTNTATMASTIPAGGGNPALFFSANDIAINQGTGVLSTTNATVGVQNGATEAATIYGNFAGTNATGVSGLVYSNDSSRANYAGAFYGTR